MSIVVAVQKNDRIVMAADTLVCFGDDVVIPSANASVPKIQRLGSVVIGGTGWAVYDDIFRDYLHDKPAPELADERSIFTFFMNLWKVLHENYAFVNDQAADKDTPFGELDATFLITNRKGIFKVSSDMGITKFNQYYAVGSGSDYALGALYNLYDMDLDVSEIARRAVHTAIQFDVHCGGEIDVLLVE